MGSSKKQTLRTPETITKALLTGNGFHIIRSGKPSKIILFMDEMYMNHPERFDGFLFISDEEWEILIQFIEQNNISTEILDTLD